MVDIGGVDDSFEATAGDDAEPLAFRRGAGELPIFGFYFERFGFPGPHGVVEVQ